MRRRRQPMNRHSNDSPNRNPNPNPQAGTEMRLPWNLAELFATPQVTAVSEMDEDDVSALWIEGLPYQGKPTRVFAYYGLPQASKVSASGGKAPAMVLVHGGGGTAFKEWVRIWTHRGYAAIAMDVEGHWPTEKTESGAWPKHAWSGPCRQGEFADYALPVAEQWMYHAVAAVILSHSFLRTQDGVDPGRIGIHGISWGGILTGLVAGVDHRFAFAIPVYGCGYLFEAENQYGRSFTAMPPACAEKIKRLWDPSAYLHRIAIPTLWVHWSDDPHFPLHLFSKSYESARNGLKESVMSIHLDLGHSHAKGWKPQEIYAFADQIALGGVKLPQVIRSYIRDRQAKVVYACDMPVTKAELLHTSDTSSWFDIHWQVSEAHIDPSVQEISAALPENARACFFQMTDERGYVVSSPIRLHG
ncbi:hypothetical protein CF651_15440 [Paenibacillus rigui]|uniref:Peptidase S9 prolyl oligopeptidase catalytic domain-containing protein n=2 Tax=Paenibacillus rigui TaxID=554312 RepID=A0A229UQA4_9BACL|nr:hypothetical protein CF651_15440 [Paenibacillus rigui]